MHEVGVEALANEPGSEPCGGSGVGGEGLAAETTLDGGIEHGVQVDAVERRRDGLARGVPRNAQGLHLPEHAARPPSADGHVMASARVRGAAVVENPFGGKCLERGVDHVPGELAAAETEPDLRRGELAQAEPAEHERARGRGRQRLRIGFAASHIVTLHPLHGNVNFSRSV